MSLARRLGFCGNGVEYAVPAVFEGGVERYEEDVKSSDAVVSSLFVIVSILLAVKIGCLATERVFE
jgi:hypothetical protein